MHSDLVRLNNAQKTKTLAAWVSPHRPSGRAYREMSSQRYRRFDVDVADVDAAE